MPDPLIVPADGAKDVATVTIKSGGQPVPQTFRVAGLAITRGVGRLPAARVDLFDGDPAGQTFAASGDALFSPGQSIEIAVGWRSQESVLFQGVLTSQRIRIRKESGSRLTLWVRHPLYQASLFRRSRSIAQKSDDQILKQIFQEYGVSLTNRATGLPVHEVLVQADVTDWDFARQRAEALGLWLVPDDGGATLGPLDAGQEPALSLRHGATILELDAQLDARRQPVGAKVQTWDPVSQKMKDASGAEPQLPAAGSLSAPRLAEVHGQSSQVHHMGSVNPDEARAAASARLIWSRLRRLCGRVRCEGTPEVHPGKVVELLGLGDLFNGRHIISAIRHEIVGGTWTTDIEFGCPLDPLIGMEAQGAEAAAGLVPVTNGLRLGKVAAISDDPASEFRVQVDLPYLGPDAEAVWARLAQFDAGPDRGAFFYPEVGDEVILGFLSGDSRYPVILGSLHSSTQAAPWEPQSANPQKGFVSREKVRWIIDDDAKSMRFETPGGNFVELSDDASGLTIQDQNGNKIVFDSSGIVLESAAELAIKSGTSCQVESGTTLTVKGGSGAEFSSGGTTKLKGTTVQIN